MSTDEGQGASMNDHLWSAAERLRAELGDREYAALLAENDSSISIAETLAARMDS